MNIISKQSVLVGPVLATIFIGSLFWCLISTANAETSVINSVRVSANGTSENHASVHTVINGEVVEDWSTTTEDPIEYTSAVVTATSTPLSSSQDTTNDHLKAVIAQLQALISLYVSLLNS